MALPSDSIHGNRINYDRYCPHCRVVTPWRCTLRRHPFFVGLNCSCLNCGHYEGAIIPLG